MVVIKFSNYGSSLATRSMGKKLVPEARELIGRNSKVTFDFNGIDMLSLSFSDEFFGTLIDGFGFETFKRKTHFINTSEVVTQIISVAINMKRQRTEA